LQNAVIRGFQECSLLDWDGKICCTIFVERCNFRCLFCHNPELVDVLVDVKEDLEPKERKENNHILEDKIIDYLTSNKDFIDGVCITGGEPTISNIQPILEKIKSIGLNIKLDTNGSNPEILESLVNKKLIDYIAMDIKSNKDKYEKIVGTKVNIERLDRSIEFIKNSKIEYEFRTTYIPKFMNEKDVSDIAHWLGGKDRHVNSWVIQRFQPNNCLDKSFTNLPPPHDEEMNLILNIAKKIIPNARLRG